MPPTDTLMMAPAAGRAMGAAGDTAANALSGPAGRVAESGPYGLAILLVVGLGLLVWALFSLRGGRG